ncbi:MAG: TraB/GumN family protein [Flavobacteriaceae bacterium]
MKKVLLAFCLLVSLTVISQNQNSLLWKISGNGLEKDSYLFGTMHVSERIAFHLDDVFYESLLKSDFVALESNPEFWLDHYLESDMYAREFNALNYKKKSFYNLPFKLEPVKIEMVKSFLSFDNFMLNNILYRTNASRQDFQEETYLDMFIFQGGSKFGKKIIGLENIKRSERLVKKATEGQFRKKKPDAWLQKMIKKKGYLTLMSDSYRNRNISFLDSLNTAIYTEKYLDHMLYKRNTDMVNGIDSIVKQGSLFSGVGAAHLGGEKGIIQMLRNRGYTVTPLVSEKTTKGEELKKKIEAKMVEIDYKTQTSSDGFFSVKAPNKLYEIGVNDNTMYLIPNLQNGAFGIITRLNLVSFSRESLKDIKEIEAVLFENIPGEIIKKSHIEKNHIKGIDIVNKTKVGDYQRYQIFLTPLEIIIFKMSGKDDFVIKHGNPFFNSITFPEISDKKKNVSPENGGFAIKFPEFHVFANKGKEGDRLIQGIDKKGDYYFVREVVLNDYKYIEEDDFELERIHERFYKNIDLNYDAGAFLEDKDGRVFISKKKMKTEDRWIHLKTKIKGGFYYLAGKITKDSQEPSMYFDSFNYMDLSNVKKKMKKVRDTSLLFSVNTYKKPIYNYSNRRGKKKSYEPYTKTSNYNNLTNENITVKLKKFHDWTSYSNIDSLWNDEVNVFKKKNINTTSALTPDRILLDEIINNTKKSYQVTDKEIGKDIHGNDYLSFLLRNPLSSRAIKYKKVLVDNKLYTLTTLIDVRYPETTFVKEFYSSFTPDKKNEKKVDLFEDKTNVFIKALKAKDSIALNGYTYVNFKETDGTKLMSLLRDFEFEKDQQSIKRHLIKQLSKNKSKKATNFIENLYKNSFENPYNQIEIFKAIAKRGEKNSYKELLKLLNYDTPLTLSGNDIGKMFSPMRDSILLMKKIFPELLDFTSIEEYKAPIYGLLSKLLDEKMLTKEVYKKYKKQILTEAIIELKRQLSNTIDNNNLNINSYQSYSNRLSKSEGSLLSLYTKLLFPYRKDTKVKEFLSRIKLIDNISVKSTYLVEKAKVGEVLPQRMVNEIMEKVVGRRLLFKEFSKIGKTNLLPKKYNTKEKIYESLILYTTYYREKNDSIIFLGKKDLKIKDKEYEVFFYKRNKNLNYSNWNLHFAAFLKEGAKIQKEYYIKLPSVKIDKTDSLDDVFKLNLEKIRLKNRNRVNLNKQRGNLYGYY